MITTNFCCTCLNIKMAIYLALLVNSHGSSISHFSFLRWMKKLQQFIITSIKPLVHAPASTLYRSVTACAMGLIPICSMSYMSFVAARDWTIFCFPTLYILLCSITCNWMQHPWDSQSFVMILYFLCYIYRLPNLYKCRTLWKQMIFCHTIYNKLTSNYFNPSAVSRFFGNDSFCRYMQVLPFRIYSHTGRDKYYVLQYITVFEVMCAGLWLPWGCLVRKRYYY